MKYLFFDLEAASSLDKKGNTCEFGYVIINEKYKVLEKDNIYINPNCEKWEQRVLDKIITKPKEFYLEKPTFDKYYEKIKSILLGVDAVFGYALNNDIGRLKQEYKKYKLSPVEFNFIEVNEIYKEYRSSSNQIGLKKALVESKINLMGEEHDALDDAFNTMQLTKFMCNELNSSIKELVDIYKKSCYFSTKDFTLCGNSKEQQKLKNLKRKRNKEYSKFTEALLSIKPNNKIDDEYFKNKKVCFSREFEENNKKIMKFLVHELVNREAVYTSSIKKASVFIRYDEKDQNGNIKKCDRLSRIEKNPDLKGIEIIDYSELLNKLNIKEDELKEKIFFDETSRNKTKFYIGDKYTDIKKFVI